MANYSKLKVIWRNNLNNIYKENTIIGVGQEAVINIDENSISNIYVNFKVNDDFFTDLVEINGNVIQVPFKTDVLKVGTHQLEIVAYLKNGDVVPSPTFSYYVEKSLENANDIKAETYYPILIELLEKVEEWNEGAVYQEEQRIANENERKSNEINRQSNEDTRISNENTRQSNESSRQQYETQRRVEEDERLTDEQARVNAENIRIANENERLRKEIERQNAEELRQISYNSSLYGRMDEVEDRLAHTMKVFNVKEFGGAVGDGVNDDTNCLQTIIDSLNDGDTLFFPKGLYKTTSTLVIKRAIKLQMQGTIVAHHSNTTLLFKNDEPQGNFSNNKADICFLDCEISITRDSKDGDKTNENAIGVEIWNAYYPRFLFKKVTNNYTGVKLKAEKYGTGYAGVSYGTFFITLLNNYHCNIYIETGTDGYITQNQFYGGSLTGGYGAGDDSVHIFLNNIGNSVVNENTFFGNSLEGHMKIAVKGKGVTGNKFISLRYEMPSMTKLIDFLNCQRNEFTNSEYVANAMFNNLFNIETTGSMSTKGHNTLIEYIDYRIGKVTYFDGIFYITPLANLNGAYSGSNNGVNEGTIPKTWEQVEIIKNGYADAFMYTTAKNTVDGILTIPCCYNDKHIISEQVEFSTIKLEKPPMHSRDLILDFRNGAPRDITISNGDDIAIIVDKTGNNKIIPKGKVMVKLHYRYFNNAIYILEVY